MSAFTPSISILLPVYNDSAYLLRAVASMRRQTVWEGKPVVGYKELPVRYDGTCSSLPSGRGGRDERGSRM